MTPPEAMMSSKEDIVPLIQFNVLCGDSFTDFLHRDANIRNIGMQLSVIE